VWSPFFFAPFIVPDLLSAQMARDLASLACVLLITGHHLSHTCSTSQSNKSGLYHWLFLAFLFTPTTILLLSGQADNPWMTWRQALYLGGVWLIYAMTRNAPPQWFASQRWALLLLGIAITYLLYALAAPFHQPSNFNSNLWLHWWSERIAHFPGPLRQQNGQALFMAMVALVTWRQMTASDRPVQWALASLIPVCALWMTASRGGAIILLLSVALVWWADRFRLRSLLLMVAVLAVGWMLAQSIFTLYPDGMGGSVLAHSEAMLTDQTPSMRMMIWRISIETWQLHPWFGGGSGTLPAHAIDSAIEVIKHHPEYAQIAQDALAGGNVYAHNLLLQYLMDYGIMGAGAILLLIGALIRQAWGWGHTPPINDARVTGWMVAVIFLIHGMVSVTMMHVFFMVLFATALAVCFAIPQTETQVSTDQRTPILRLTFLLPALIFASFWLHVVSQGRHLEQLNQQNINQSPALRQALNRAIEDPWMHLAGMEQYFLHLANDGATRRKWSDSENLALAFWSEFQYANDLRFLMVVYHAQNNTAKALEWEQRYALALQHESRQMPQ